MVSYHQDPVFTAKTHPQPDQDSHSSPGDPDDPGPRQGQSAEPTQPDTRDTLPSSTYVTPQVWVPRTLSASCDQAVFVDHAADAGVSADVVSVKIDRFG
jgi:hypothetical protein